MISPGSLQHHWDSHWTEVTAGSVLCLSPLSWISSKLCAQRAFPHFCRAAVEASPTKQQVVNPGWFSLESPRAWQHVSLFLREDTPTPLIIFFKQTTLVCKDIVQMCVYWSRNSSDFEWSRNSSGFAWRIQSGSEHIAGRDVNTAVVLPVSGFDAT